MPLFLTRQDKMKLCFYPVCITILACLLLYYYLLLLPNCVTLILIMLDIFLKNH